MMTIIGFMATLWVIGFALSTFKGEGESMFGLLGLSLSILIFPVRMFFDILQWIEPRFNKFMGIVGATVIGSLVIFVVGCLLVIAFRKLFL